MRVVDSSNFVEDLNSYFDHAVTANVHDLELS